MSVRAKFKVSRVTRICMGGGVQHEEVHLSPVYSSDPNHENKRFWDATPNGDIRLYIVNPGAHGALQLGAEYYVDFTPAE